MALIRWQPFGDIDRFFDNDFFSGSNQGWDLAVDTYEDKDGNIVAEMNLPGIDPDNLDINVEDNYLTISGERQQESNNNDNYYYSREIRRGSFERTVRLPQAVKSDKAEAYYDDGVLRIVMPKQKEGKENRINVRIGKKGNTNPAVKGKSRGNKK